MIADLIEARTNKSVAVSGEGNKNISISGNFSTLLLVGRINSGLGWLMVLGCIVAIIIGPMYEAVFSLGGIVLLPISLLVVASGQAISCFVSTERNGKETTILLQKILDKMERIG